ncbi:uncharacterized protein BX663DRAFT_528966 [Cokeromyces recurvatus]|uniref:uncharacterized protein n=1 Tax=Cokeromyces recurvatus TaxID=90255 RepID=UPI00221E5F77|nr:uncharacterized protein BX663DRAFT_528966 [Cokeromyces recurvatus]KAI7907188.1 hypothetical protein BX663DRAFT_528966 [Cokeromyces recurvatus]
MIFLGEIICILVIHLVTKAPSMLDRSMLDTVTVSTEADEWNIPHTFTWSWPSLWFIFPSVFDLIATTFLNLGLIYTTPSIYQMIKSSIVGFSAIVSCLFLSRRFLFKDWCSIGVILLGACIVFLSTQRDDDEWIGPSLLVIAQLFVAGQFILEEYLMDRYHLDPVKAMGIEGVFGTVLLMTGLIMSSLIGHSMFDVKRGFEDILTLTSLWQSSILLSLMVAIFNFFGLIVSTSIGVPGRSMIDALRTILTWIIAIHYGWDSFSWLEFIGFFILILGVFIFNGVFSTVKSTILAETTPLLS